MRKSGALLYWLGIAGTAAPAQAQVADRAQALDAASHEIVVTAQKRAQSIEDVPLSVTAVSGDQLRGLGISDTAGLANLSANVVATTSANLPAITIRGVGLNEFASNFDSPVAVEVDEVYKSKPYMASIPIYDLDRVEILKGPQGTLFGRNTTGGTVNYFISEPTQSSSGGMNLSGDNFARFHVDGFLNTGITDDLAARFSYYVAQGSGGPYHNLYTGSRYGAPDQLAGRFQLKWHRNGTTVRMSAYAFRDRSEVTPYKSPGIFNADGSYCAPLLTGHIDDNRAACLRYGPFAIDPANPSGLRETQDIRQINADYGWKANNKAAGISLHIEQDLGAAKLVSITSYDHFRRIQREDGDDSPYVTVNDHFYSGINQFTQELRIAGKAGQLNYLVGGFYEHDDLNEFNSVNGLQNPLLGLPPFAPRLMADFTQKVRSLALFTHEELELTKTLSLVAGLRYTNDRTRLNALSALGANDPQGAEQRVTPVIPVDALDGRRTDGTTSFRAGINWHFRPGQLLYGSISRGFRSGGYSVPFGGEITTFSPERLTAYEIGYKGRITSQFDFNVAGFRYDYKDLQVNVDAPASVVPITKNIGASRSYGVDADLLWHTPDGWLARLGVGYLDARFRNTDAVVTTYAGVVGLDGKRPVNTPKWTLQGLVQKTVPVSDAYQLVLETDAKFISARYLEATGQIFDRAPAYAVQNARIAFGPTDGRWEFAIFGKNIWNREYLTYLNNVSFFRLEIYGDPASYGAQASFKF